MCRGDTLPDGFDEDAILMLEQGRRLAKAGRAREALPFFEQTVHMLEAELDQGTSLAFLLHELALVYRDAGRADRAEAELRRALVVLEKTVGADHQEVLSVVSDLADLLAEADRHAEAEDQYRRMLDLLRGQRQAGDPDMVAVLGHLALLADVQGRGDQAESQYLQAIEMADQGQQESPELAAALHNLASIYYRRAALDDAEPLYRRALDLRQRLLGRRHWVVAVSMSDLAALLYDRRQVEEAQTLVEQAAALLEPYCGALNAEAEGVRRSAREVCRDTSTLQQRLARPTIAEDPAAKPSVPDPRPETVELQSQPRQDEPGKDAYWVQLSSRQDQDLARTEQAQFRNRFPDLLGDLESRLKTVDLDAKGVWHRLQFGTFATRDEAKALCGVLRQRGLTDCWIAGP